MNLFMANSGVPRSSPGKNILNPDGPRGQPQVHPGPPQPLCLTVFLLLFARSYEIVEAEATNHIVRWSPTGASFLVLNVTAFSKDILPRYFKHSK